MTRAGAIGAVPRAPARGLLAWLMAAALVLACAAPAGASDWRALARSMAAPWPAIQQPDGVLPDYLDAVSGAYGGLGGTRYGDALMGYGLLQAGVRERDDAVTDAGLRALTFVTQPGRVLKPPSVFEQLAVASAYNLARRRIPRRPAFAHARAQWERWLRGLKTVRLAHEDRYGNHWLVDALTVLELRRSGLHSRGLGTILGSGAAAARRRALRLIDVGVPALAPPGRPFVLSDPPDDPLAYHGLSLGLYARALRLLGRRAAPDARRVLRQAVRAAALATAPDGDLSYFGRSQGESWALAGAAYGAELVARRGGLPRRERAHAHGVAQRALGRLRAAYPVGPRGQLITPALAEDLRAGARGLDAYAGASSMAGLTLVLLNWTLELQHAGRGRAVLPAEHRVRATLATGDGRFAVVRKGPVWLAVRMTRSRRHAGDLRYDAGLGRALVRTAAGWRELVPVRPRTRRAWPASAGPVLRGGWPGYFHGNSIRIRRDGAVLVRGEFRTASGRVRRSASLLYRPLACGVALSFGARRGEAFRLSAFFNRPPRVAGTHARDGFQTVSAWADRSALRLARGTAASGEHARLWRVDAALGARTSRALGLRFIAPGCRPSQEAGGRRSAHGRAVSSWAASDSSVASSFGRPTI